MILGGISTDAEPSAWGLHPGLQARLTIVCWNEWSKFTDSWQKWPKVHWARIVCLLLRRMRRFSQGLVAKLWRFCMQFQVVFFCVTTYYDVRGSNPLFQLAIILQTFRNYDCKWTEPNVCFLLQIHTTLSCSIFDDVTHLRKFSFLVMSLFRRKDVSNKYWQS